MNPLLIIDFDSTFIRDETLDEIAKITSSSNKKTSNIHQKIKEITTQAMEGKIDFKDALKERLNLLKFHKNELDDIVSILKERVSLSFIKNKKYIQSISSRIYIVSGGFKEIILPIVQDYGVSSNHIFANEFKYNTKGYINGINENNLLSYSDGKIKILQTLNLRNGAYVIGDGNTDLEMKNVKGVKAFICFTENIDRPSVSSKADHTAPSLDDALKFINKKESDG